MSASGGIADIAVSELRPNAAVSELRPNADFEIAVALLTYCDSDDPLKARK
jgi:hypothetical protein